MAPIVVNMGMLNDGIRNRSVKEGFQMVAAGMSDSTSKAKHTFGQLSSIT